MKDFLIKRDPNSQGVLNYQTIERRINECYLAFNKRVAEAQQEEDFKLYCDDSDPSGWSQELPASEGKWAARMGNKAITLHIKKRNNHSNSLQIITTHTKIFTILTYFRQVMQWPIDKVFFKKIGDL